MPTFKGNKGNLLQHWVLAELTLLLRSQFPSAHLSLIDAHAMSPYATRSPGASANVFDVVQNRLPGQGSAYEHAWSQMAGQKGSRAVEYPTTAMFVRHLWRGPLAMVLCDIDKATIDDVSHNGLPPWVCGSARRLHQLRATHDNHVGQVSRFRI